MKFTAQLNDTCVQIGYICLMSDVPADVLKYAHTILIMMDVS